MKTIRHQYLALGITFLCISMGTPALATALIEGDDDGFNTMAVQLIESDQIKQSAAQPRAYGHVSFEDISESATLESDINLSGESGRDVSTLIAMYNRSLDTYEVNRISRTIHTLSDSYDLDPRLMASVVAVESSFRPRAVSSSGAMGLGQLKPATARWLGVSNPFDPLQNLVGVAKYLRYLMDRYHGSTKHAVAAYYRGQGRIDRQGIDPGAIYYVNKVKKVFGWFH